MVTGGPLYRPSLSRGVPAALLALLLLVVAVSDTIGIRRTLTAAVIRYHYRGWLSMETARFHLRFIDTDREEVEWVAAEAERVAMLVDEALEYSPATAKPWLVVAPDQGTIRRAFGWGEGTGVLGAYLAHTIIVLSPQVFSEADEAGQRKLYKRQGPLVHEFTHYVVDARTGGNYPRWFSEGLAQLMEYRLLSFEWLEAGSSLGQQVYSPDELKEGFDSLDNQPLAYRQALSLVTYLESLQGLDGINRLLDTLARGKSFNQAVYGVYGMDSNAFHENWQKWFPSQPRWFLPRQD